MIVIGALLAAVSIGLRSQTVWLTVPLLVLVLVDRIGRGVAGAMLGGGVTFGVGGLLWGIPLLVASGGLNAYLAALGTQAGEDFAAGEMLYLNPSPRSAAFALLRTFVVSVGFDAARSGRARARGGRPRSAGVRDRRSLAAVVALAGPVFRLPSAVPGHVFVRYALPLVPSVAFLAVRGVALVSGPAVPVVAAAASRRGRRRLPVRCSWRTAPSRVRPCARSRRCRPKRSESSPARWRCTRRFCGRSKPKTSASRRNCLRRRAWSGSSW